MSKRLRRHHKHACKQCRLLGYYSRRDLYCCDVGHVHPFALNYQSEGPLLCWQGHGSIREIPRRLWAEAANNGWEDSRVIRRMLCLAARAGLICKTVAEAALAGLPLPDVTQET